MNYRTFTFRSLRYHWRANLAVAVGVAVSSSVLAGALAVGDSLRESLRQTALRQLGRADAAVVSQGRPMNAAIAERLARQFNVSTSPILQVPATASRADDGRWAKAVVLGVDAHGGAGDFWAFAPSRPARAPGAGEALISETLARKLGVGIGDAVALTLRQAGTLPLDAPLALDAQPVAAEVVVIGIAGPEELGEFSLRFSQTPPPNLIVPLDWLQKKLGSRQGATAILLASNVDVGKAGLAQSVDDLPADLHRVGEAWELTSDAVFIEPALAAAAAADRDAVGILTYFANDLAAGDGHTPYSMITAIGMLNAAGDANALPPHIRDLKDDEILVSPWLADDLNLRGGEPLGVKYFVIGPGRDLDEAAAEFGALPGDAALWADSNTGDHSTPLAIDRSLMPAFPGLAESNDCRQWRPGVPIDLKRVREKDEQYWERYRGTPKAVVTLSAGRQLWGNRFGNLTAVRFSGQWGRDELSRAIARAVDARALGLSVEPVKSQALAACEKGASFGGLFVGFSFFLVAAALLLAAMLLALTMEQRGGEIGTLLAAGMRPRQVARLLLPQVAILSLAGAAVGAVAAGLYARAVLAGLTTAWRDALAGASVEYHWGPMSLAGAAAAFAASMIAGAFVLRSATRRPIAALLAGRPPGVSVSRSRAWAAWAMVLSLATGLAAAAYGTYGCAGGAMNAAQQAAAFFAAGAMLLAAAMLGLWRMLRVSSPTPAAGEDVSDAAASADRQSQSPQPRVTPGFLAPLTSIGELGWSNARRRRGRSVAVAAMIACGSFLVVAVGANRHDPAEGTGRRDSGTGGFALVGVCAQPLAMDLADANARRAAGLESPALAGLGVVPLRVRDGDDASCLNLAHPARPRILGVEAAALESRGAFAFGGWGGGTKWGRLNDDLGPGVIPAIADAATAEWSLGLAVGDELAMADERGLPVRLRLVATLEGSILQGGLIIAERQFLDHFPSSGGWRMLLLDLPAGAPAGAAAEFCRRPFLREAGLELTPATARLAELQSVENAYLSIFAALGGLGVVLGCAGLGIVVMRNVLQRRRELAMLRAVGFSRRQLQWMILCEHWGLLLCGLAAGAACAAVAVLPALLSPGAAAPLVELAVALAAMAASGVLCTYLAARWALRGRLMDALREE